MSHAPAAGYSRFSLVCGLGPPGQLGGRAHNPAERQRALAERREHLGGRDQVQPGPPFLAKPFALFITEQLDANRIGLLPIELRHTFEVARLPQHHRDPFDRLLIAQALAEHVPVVSADSAFDAYPVQRLW